MSFHEVIAYKTTCTFSIFPSVSLNTRFLIKKFNSRIRHQSCISFTLFKVFIYRITFFEKYLTLLLLLRC